MKLKIYGAAFAAAAALCLFAATAGTARAELIGFEELYACLL